MGYLNTYIFTGDDQILDKSNHLTSVGSNISIKILDDTSIISPVITLSAANGDGWNYCYMSDTGWYYFLSDRTFANGHYIIKLELDDKMSFHSEIESLNVVANRSYSRYNLYQRDSKIPKLEKDLIQTQPFRYGFTGAQSFILAVNGK